MPDSLLFPAVLGLLGVAFLAALVFGSSAGVPTVFSAPQPEVISPGSSAELCAKTRDLAADQIPWDGTAVFSKS